MDEILLLGGGSRHVDPSKFSFAELAHVRGGMWTPRLNIGYGPRPFQPSNILAMDFYEYYDGPTRARMIAAYKDRGYTHAVTGPMVDLGGYHGQYPSTDIRIGGQVLWDWYLDAMQEWWDAGLVPIHFVHPDGWSLEDMGVLLKWYQQPRAQKLLRVTVWTGWEPTRYAWPNAYWNAFLDQALSVMPHALKLVHTVSDCDALTGGDDDKTLPNGNATAWQRSAPRLHGWLTQYAGYFDPIDERADPRWPAQYQQFKVNMPAALSDLHHRFRGAFGWPSDSLWGIGQALKVYLGEDASWPDYWLDWPESESLDLGDLAIRNGQVDGFLDGGRVSVP